MKALVESLSLGSGAVLVALLSAGIVWLLCFVFPESLRKVWVVIVPFALAYCLYWSPVWSISAREYTQQPLSPQLPRLPLASQRPQPQPIRVCCFHVASGLQFSRIRNEYAYLPGLCSGSSMCNPSSRWSKVSFASEPSKETDVTFG